MQKFLRVILSVFILSIFLIYTQAQSPIGASLQQQFTARFPTHSFLWNKKTGMLHRAFGKPISIPGYDSLKEDQVEQASRSFLQTLPGWKDEIQLRMNRAIFINNYWYVSFQQHIYEIPVFGSEVELRINKKGRVAAFGFDVYPEIEMEFTSILSVTEIVKRVEEFAREQGLTDIQLHHQPIIFILPPDGEVQQHPRPAYLVDWSAQNKIHSERSWVDALSGELIAREDRLCRAEVYGSVKASILPELATDAPAIGALPHLHVQLDNKTYATDANGDFTADINATATLTAQLKGPYLNVTRLAGSDAKIEMTVNPGDQVDLTWTNQNSLISERNVFFHTMRTYDFLKSIDPTLTTLDYPMSNIVEDNTATCNAYWTGTQIHYNTGAPNCINSAHSASTIAHEYGHAINDRTYNAAGVSQGLTNITLHEALADVTSMMLLDEHEFAQGFFGPGTFTRDFKNNRRFPDDLVGQQHIDGLLLSSSFWDLRELTNIETAYRLAHFARYGAPDDTDLGTAFAEYLLEVYLADDDDGDLSNRTPHWEEINEAFCNHGLGLGLFFSNSVQHEALPNTADTDNAYEVQLETLLPAMDTFTGEMILHYSTNYFQEEELVVMDVMGNNTFQGVIPAQPEGTLVKYYFTYVQDCTDQKFPLGEKESEHFSFAVGDYLPVWKDDFEADLGWIAGVSGDDATSGIWEWGIPQLTISDAGQTVQPGSDHSEFGSRCYVTGAARGSIWYANDVDNGRTTLLSPLFSAIEGREVVIQYYKWYVHGTAYVAASQDLWQVEISNDGGNRWTRIENTGQVTNLKWTKVQFKVADFIEPTDQMRMRFVAADYNPGSIVEALIDDFEVLALEELTSLNDFSLDQQIQIFPNPASRSFYVSFSNQLDASPLELKLYNSMGQFVHSQWLPAGVSEINAEAFIPGLYLVQIVHPQGQVTRKLMLTTK